MSHNLFSTNDDFLKRLVHQRNSWKNILNCIYFSKFWISLNSKLVAFSQKKSFTLIFFLDLFTRLFKKTKTNGSVCKSVIWRKKSSQKLKVAFSRNIFFFLNGKIRTQSKQKQNVLSLKKPSEIISLWYNSSLFYKFSSFIWGLFHQKSIPTWTWEADAFRFTNFPTQTLLENQVFHFWKNSSRIRSEFAY